MAKVNFGKKDNIAINLYIDTSDLENPRILDIIEEPAVPTPLPENIIQIKSIWTRPNWNLQQIIDANSYVDKVVQGRSTRVYEPNASISAQVRVLLKEWNVQEYDERFKLTFEKSIDDPRMKILTSDCMRALGDLDPPDLLGALVNRFLMYQVEKKVKPQQIS